MTSLPDIAGDNATHPITLATPARFVIFTATGSGAARVGGSTTDATHGVAVEAGGQPVAVPVMGLNGPFYQKAEFSAYVPTGCHCRSHSRKPSSRN